MFAAERGGDSNAQDSGSTERERRGNAADEAILCKMEVAEMGAEVADLFRIHSPHVVKVDKNKDIRHQGRSCRAHLLGRELQLRTKVGDFSNPGASKVLVTDIEAMSVDELDRDEEILDYGRYVAYLSPELSRLLYATKGKLFRANPDQGVAVCIDYKGETYNMAFHPYRDLTYNYPTREADFILAGETDLPIDFEIIGKAHAVIQFARPDTEDS